MKCLVTGAAGFLGSVLCQRLADHGNELVVLVRNQDGLPAGFPSDVRVVIGDILDLDSVQAAVASVDVVFHLAAMIAYEPAMRDTMFKINVDGAINIGRACLAQGCRLVHVSSMASLGFNWNAKDPPRTEASQYNLQDYMLSYCESKLESERVLLSLKGIDLVIANPGNIYGPRDILKSSRSTQVKVALYQFPFFTKGGNNIVHVDDVAEGLIRCWKLGRSGEKYILGGDNMLVKTMFEIIASLAQVPAPWISLPVWLQLLAGRLGLVPLEKVIPANMFCYFSSEKSERELGYTHRPGADALKDSVLWMLNNSSFKARPVPNRNYLPWAFVVILVSVLLLGFLAGKHIFIHE